jgi:tetratricopeptide (TPR) repeat protein
LWVGLGEPGLILDGMRRLLCRGALGLLIGVTFGPPDPGRVALSAGQQGVQEPQQLLENTARTKAEELGALLKGTALGSLGPDASRTITRWDLTVRQWKREKGAGAAPFLAEGVLFDCLGRLQGVRTPQLSSELPRPVFADLAAARPDRAAKEFEAALKRDPSLVEARFRAARIRSHKDPDAVRELERIADDDALMPFSYLAAITRAESARASQDVAAALQWYERALQLSPRSAAATIGLASLREPSAVSFNGLDRSDIYYDYPCTILTSGVETALSTRMRQLVLK